MGFEGSYLWSLRRHVGHDTVLMPGASVLVEDTKNRVLLLKRADDGTWCMPGGNAELGSSFAATATAELFEEAGIAVAVDQLVPYASISEAAIHTLTYPNGDVTHCFAIWFVLRDWPGDAADLVCDDESTASGFFDRADLPEPMGGPSLLALELYDTFVETGIFQAR